MDDRIAIQAGPYADLAMSYLGALLRADRHRAMDLVIDAVGNGVDIRDIYLKVLQPAQHEIGRLWQTNQVSVAQEHFCTAATQLVMSRLYPQVFRAAYNGHRMVATCVGGELHELGIRMVADLFEMEGWDTYYLGANTPAKSILETIVQQEADVLAISATINFNVAAMTDLVHQVRQSYDATTLKILVGGRPFNLVNDLWKRVGAHASAPSAVEAVEAAQRLLAQS